MFCAAECPSLVCACDGFIVVMARVKFEMKASARNSIHDRMTQLRFSCIPPSQNHKIPNTGEALHCGQDAMKHLQPFDLPKSGHHTPPFSTGSAAQDSHTRCCLDRTIRLRAKQIIVMRKPQQRKLPILRHDDSRKVRSKRDFVLILVSCVRNRRGKERRTDKHPNAIQQSMI